MSLFFHSVCFLRLSDGRERKGTGAASATRECAKIGIARVFFSYLSLSSTFLTTLLARSSSFFLSFLWKIIPHASRHQDCQQAEKGCGVSAGSTPPTLRLLGQGGCVCEGLYEYVYQLVCCVEMNNVYFHCLPPSFSLSLSLSLPHLPLFSCALTPLTLSLSLFGSPHFALHTQTRAHTFHLSRKLLGGAS